MAVVGIDLGTTNTVVAAVRDGRAAAIKDKQGRALLPSVVSFPAHGEPLVGYEAKERRTLDPENTVFSIKRLIGRSWDSQHVEKARRRFPFLLREGPGKATLVNCQGKDHTLPEISAMVLGAAREVAEQRLGQVVNAAVITVPANFNDLQRAATKVAGRVAGLEVLRIVNEPTAAALAYGFGKRGRERLAVYDFGGGTFDVTLLELSENVFEVLSTAGDTFLGGDDLDNEIVTRMGEELLRKHRIDMEQDNLVVEQLRAAAEKLKIDLSTRSMGRVVVSEIGFSGGKPVDFDFSLRRADFEKVAEPYLARTLEVCQEALDIAGLAAKELDQVLLVGGSTRIPLVRRRISSFFGKMPQSRINPDEVVAIGAAIQASALESTSPAAQVPAAPTPSSLQPGRRGGTKLGLAAPPSLPAESSDGPHFPRHRLKTLAGVGDEQRGPNTLSGIGEPPGPEEVRRLQQSAEEPQELERSGSVPPTGDPADEDQTARMRPSVLDYDKSRRPGTAQRKEPSAEEATVRWKPEGLAHVDGEADDEGPTGEFEQSAFDDITSVLKRPDQVARLQDKRAELSETLLGSGGPPKNAPERRAGEPPVPEGSTTEEGSVTFDLAELEEEAAAVEAKAGIRASEAHGGEADLPAVVRQRLEDIEEVSGVLEMPEDDESDLEVDLPDVTRRSLDDLPSVRRRTTSDLPSRVEADLPVISAGLPEAAQDLPERAQPDLPSYDREPELPTVARRGPPGQKSQGGAPPLPWGEDDPLEDTGILGSFPEPDPRTPLESLSDARVPPQRERLATIDESIDEALSAPSGRTITSPSSAPAPYGRTSVAVPADHRAPLLIDVTPLALGVETVGGFVETMIERNSPVPCERTHTFTTARDQQQVVRVRVSQGQGQRFIDNTLLGEVELRGLRPGPRGSVKIDVSFRLDESGMLAVSARDQETGQAADARLKLVGLGEL